MKKEEKGTEKYSMLFDETHLIHKKEDVPKGLPKDFLDFFKKQENWRKGCCESITMIKTERKIYVKK